MQKSNRIQHLQWAFESPKSECKVFTIIFITFLKINVPIFTVKSSALHKSCRYMFFFSLKKIIFEIKEREKQVNSKRNKYTHNSVSKLIPRWNITELNWSLPTNKIVYKNTLLLSESVVSCVFKHPTHLHICMWTKKCVKKEMRVE